MRADGVAEEEGLQSDNHPLGLPTCFNRYVVSCDRFLLAFVIATLPAMAEIDGIVSNERGAPVAGVSITAYRGGYPITKAKTDMRGRFRLLTFPPIVVFVE